MLRSSYVYQKQNQRGSLALACKGAVSRPRQLAEALASGVPKAKMTYPGKVSSQSQF